MRIEMLGVWLTRSRVLFVVVALNAFARSPQRTQEGPVWFWNASCGGPTMTLEVRLDKTVLYRSSFPLCRADRYPLNRVNSQGHTNDIHFSFRPQRPILWEGYRDTSDTTAAGQLIKCDLWQAGADPDDLLFGVSFVSAHTIYMNTIHIAHPDKRDETEIAKGLFVVSHPGKGEQNRKP